MDYLSIQQQGTSWISDLIVYTEKSIIHQQIEFREGKRFCRVKKRPIVQ